MSQLDSSRAACAALCLLLACAAGFTAPQRQDELARFARSAAGRIAERVATGSPIGIDQFRAGDGDRLAADLADSATEAFRRELVAQPGLRLVETEKLDAILSTLEVQASGAYDPGSVAAIGRLVGARYLGLGRVGTRGGRYVIAFRLVTVETGEIVFSEDLELAPAGARDLVRVYAPARYRVSLGAMWIPLQPAEFGMVEGGPPQSIGAGGDARDDSGFEHADVGA
jgi:TolB-like protein